MWTPIQLNWLFVCYKGEFCYDRTFHCEGEMQSQEKDERELFTDSNGKEAMFQMGAIILKIDQDKKKERNCLKWFIVVSTHCATNSGI